jgi:hypothetical protein
MRYDSLGDAADSPYLAEATTLYQKVKSHLGKMVHFKPGNPRVLLQLRKKLDVETGAYTRSHFSST